MRLFITEVTLEKLFLYLVSYSIKLLYLWNYSKIKKTYNSIQLRRYKRLKNKVNKEYDENGIKKIKRVSTKERVFEIFAEMTPNLHLVVLLICS